MAGQSRWQRITLLAVLGYEGLGSLFGGASLVASPQGRFMKIPVEVLHGAFASFRVPGLILFGLGLLNIAAFVSLWRRSRPSWLLAWLAIGGMMVWFLVEIVILRELHWLHVMWGYPVLLGAVAAVPLLPFPAAVMRDVWLACGPLSSLLYVSMNVFVPRLWPGYDSASQTVSELSAVGAPTRPLWVVLALVYTLLVVAFGWGVRLCADGNRRLRAAATLIVVYGALGVLWVLAPMHLRPTLAAGGSTLSDTFHIALATVTVLLFLAALALAATALGGTFRLYSIATFVLLLAFAVLTFREAPRVGSDLPTPFIGVWERANIALFLLWVVVLAATLMARGRPVRHRADFPAVARWRRLQTPAAVSQRK
jgi:hypothetical protein